MFDVVVFGSGCGGKAPNGLAQTTKQMFEPVV